MRLCNLHYKINGVVKFHITVTTNSPGILFDDLASSISRIPLGERGRKLRAGRAALIGVSEKAPRLVSELEDQQCGLGFILPLTFQGIHNFQIYVFTLCQENNVK